jgi:hypothetical protein
MREFFWVVFLGLTVCLLCGCCGIGNDTDPPRLDGGYLTMDSQNLEIYVTDQPIEGANSYRAESGIYSSVTYYYGDMRVNVPFITLWSDGRVTISVSGFEGISYTNTETAAYNSTSFVNDGTGPVIDGVIVTNEVLQESYLNEASREDADVFFIGTAPANHTRSDYASEPDPITDKYTYNGDQTDTLQQDAQADTNSLDNENDDNSIPSTNDGVPIE